MTGHDTDDDSTGEQGDRPEQADQSADGIVDAEDGPVTDGGTADSPAAGGGEQSQSQAQPEAPSQAGDAAAGEASTDDSRSSGERLAWLVQIGALVVLCLLALVATFRFYFAASQAIQVWISEDFVSVFQAAFNLLVLIASVYGVSVLVRRLG